MMVIGGRVVVLGINPKRKGRDTVAISVSGAVCMAEIFFTLRYAKLTILVVRSFYLSILYNGDLQTSIFISGPVLMVI